MDLEKLKQEIPFKWKIQSFNKDKTKASNVAYIDARDVMNVLDEVCGPENWQDDYKTVDGHFFAGIGIKCGEEWVWKYDTGTEAKTEAEKSQFSDGFKRAAVKWGIGRFLYKQNIVWCGINKYKKPLDKNGKELNDKEYQEYCNKLNLFFHKQKGEK